MPSEAMMPRDSHVSTLVPGVQQTCSEAPSTEVSCRQGAARTAATIVDDHCAGLQGSSLREEQSSEW